MEAERAVDEEIRHHIAELTDRLIADGWPREAAKREAERRFGNVARHREAMVRETRRREWAARLAALPGHIVADLRHGARGLRRSPTFALTLIVTLALGLSAAAAVFTVLDAVVLRPLPYRDAGRLVSLNRVEPDGFAIPFLEADQIARWGEAADVVGPLVAHHAAGVTRTDGPEPAVLYVLHVAHELDDVIGLRALLGRTFTAEDAVPGVNRAMLGFAYWKALGLGRQAIGSTLRIDGLSYEVVGVLPEDFKFPAAGFRPDLWLAIRSDFTSAGEALRGASVVARLADGVTLESAQARLDAIAEALAREQPDERGWRVALELVGQQRGNPDVVRGLWFMGGGVVLMLLIALTNGVNLLLFRAADRGREIAVRLAVGGSRRRVMGQLLAEGLVVGLASGLAAVVLAQIFVVVTRSLLPEEIASSSAFGIRIEHRVLIFTFVMSLVCGVVLGVIPGIRAVRSRAVRFDLLKDRGTTDRDGRLNLVLTGAEIALAVALLLAGGLLTNSLLRLSRVDPGFDAERIAVLALGLTDTHYPTPEARAAFYNSLRDELVQLSSVEAVTVADGVPPWTGARFGRALQAEGSDRLPEWTELLLPTIQATPDFLPTLGGRIVRGRDLIAGDVGTDNVLVDDALADRLWQGDALGKRLRISEEGPWLTVVGVFAHITTNGLDDRAVPYAVITPRDPTLAGWYMSLGIRTAGDPSASLEMIRRTVRNADPELAIWRLMPAAEAFRDTIDKPRFLATVMTSLSLVALALAALGVYGVLSYAVIRRRREMGIRMALGATPAVLRRAVLGRGLVVAFVGILLGLAGGQGLTRLVRGLLFGVQPADPLTLTIVAGVVAVTAALASFLPARRASRLDPVDVLRAE